MAATGRFSAGFEGQPVAHAEHFWNALAMVLVGLTGVLAGGCPVRQVVLVGEGNGDAMVTAAGILVGAVLAHPLQLASTPAGTTSGGRIAVLVGLAVCLGYATALILAHSRQLRADTPK